MKRRQHIKERNFELILDDLLGAAAKAGRELRAAAGMSDEPDDPRVPDVSRLLRDELRKSLLEHFEVRTLEHHLTGWAPRHLTEHLNGVHNIRAHYTEGIDVLNELHRHLHKEMGDHAD